MKKSRTDILRKLVISIRQNDMALRGVLSEKEETH
jgi:hypothetical protein